MNAERVDLNSEQMAHRDAIYEEWMSREGRILIPKAEGDESLGEAIASFVLLAFILGYEAGTQGARIPEGPSPIVSKPPRTPKAGEAWRDLTRREGYGGGKFEVREVHLKTMMQFPQLYEFVSDKPHGDGDFSYLCAHNYCRCTE